MINLDIQGSRLRLEPIVEDIGANVLYQMANDVKDLWVKEATNTLKTTAGTYVSSINMEFTMGATLKAEIYLEGSWAKKLELGFQPYDMKPVFARSDKRKTSKDGGWYMDIPFKHTTPAATGRTGMPMPSSVYRKARNLPLGGRLPSNMGNFGGMQKQKESPTSSRSSYMTWRRVSNNSSPDAFKHPGFSGAKVLDRVSGKIDDIFSRVYSSR
ncbi:hypothetical protein CampHawk_79 [Bacillus phage CampHawk]|uniref:Tail protein n=1 Tax=Bacillus phage CampHawk TaxID=1406783 RepID=U5PWI6_9CAUD|nr:hypothetical protein CampHawk_79 [Bacillus phage CampHawk]AGY46957.1 hypothetical protein CampHawk_79 [Bacillus phage CampHawk]